MSYLIKCDDILYVPTMEKSRYWVDIDRNYAMTDWGIFISRNPMTEYFKQAMETGKTLGLFEGILITNDRVLSLDVHGMGGSKYRLITNDLTNCSSVVVTSRQDESPIAISMLLKEFPFENVLQFMGDRLSTVYREWRTYNIRELMANVDPEKLKPLYSGVILNK